MLGEFDDYEKQTLATIQHPAALKYAQQNMLALRETIGNRAMTFEAQAGVANRADQLDQSLQQFEQVVASDLSQVKTARTAVLGQIANGGFDPIRQADLGKRATERLAEAALTGAVRRDPAGVKASGQQFYGMSPAGAIAATANTVEAVWPSVERRESGGRQSAVSSEGAVGVAQVMPGTGPEAAALAGLPWDPQRFKSDSDYNRKLGQAYLQQQLNTFGSMDKALAAYNAGPGRVQKLVEQYGNAWLSQAPQETRSYVAGILGQPSSSTAPAAAVGAPSAAYDELFRSIPVERIPAFINAAEAEVNRNSAAIRANLEGTAANHLAGFQNGVVPQRLLTEGEFAAAYAEQGPSRYAAYQAAAQTAQDVNSLRTLPPDQARALVEQAAPPANSDAPGYANSVARYAQLIDAANKVRQSQVEDPMAYAQQAGLGSHPLDFSSPDKFQQEMAQRTGVARTMQDTYQAPFALMTKVEAQQLAVGFNQATPRQQRDLLETLRKTVPDEKAFNSVLQQIRPDSPVTAYAGLALSRDQSKTLSGSFWWSKDTTYNWGDVAQTLLAGEALLNPTKGAKNTDGKGASFPMPEDSLLRDRFVSQVGAAFGSSPQQASLAFQAVKAYYAGKAAKDSDYSGVINTGRVDEAIEATLSGVSNLNGKGKVFRPYRMDERTFESTLRNGFSKAVAANGYTGSMLDNFNAYGAVALEGDKYWLRSGNGLLINKDGTPVVIDMAQPPRSEWDDVRLDWLSGSPNKATPMAKPSTMVIKR